MISDASVNSLRFIVFSPLRKMPESPAACSGDEWQVLAFFVKYFKGFHPSNSPKEELNIRISGAKPLWVKKIACFCEAEMPRRLERG
jgi:hypothetical protein